MSRNDLDELLNVLLPHAQQLLKKHGEFYPFAASMRHDGEIGLEAAYAGEEHPASQEVLDLLIQGFRLGAREGRYRAVGICVDVCVKSPNGHGQTDAVRVSLEHAAGNAVEVYLPYRKGLLGRITYGELFATERTPEVFPATT